MSFPRAFPINFACPIVELVGQLDADKPAYFQMKSIMELLNFKGLIFRLEVPVLFSMGYYTPV
jgi:hypothetical protein